MPPTNFPLRWETTGHQWWYASPIDWAAASGHYDLVRELLYIDPNLLFKLTSLRRIHRLETMWDDELEFDDVANNRSQVAQKLLLECENRKSTLVGCGYGGWLLYTAASAGDLDFVKKLLEKNSLLVFGEGEYGVTDILYAAARSKSSEVFRLLIEFSGFWRPLSDNGGEEESKVKEVPSVFKFEMTNRVVHAAARGGNLEVLKEFLEECSDVLVYRDSQGSTLLHTASGRGQIEIVKYLMSSYDIISSKDKHGNTALHVAAYRGYLAVIEVLVSTFPSSTSATNSYGDTLLHMAVASFRTPGFRRQDRQIESMKQLVCGNIVNMQDLINVQNNEGKTALHMAITENIHTDLVELLMKIPEISFNIRDASKRTPLDLIKQQQQLPSSETVRKYLYSGRISKFEDYMIRRMLVSHIKMHGIRGSPGSSFRVADAEIMYLKDAENAGAIKCDHIEDATCPDVPTHHDSMIKPKLLKSKRFGSVNQAAKHLKVLLQWPMGKDINVDASISMEVDNDSLQSYNTNEAFKYSPQISLRQRFSQHSSLPNNRRVMLPCLSDFPSASTRNKLNAGLGHGVLKLTPQFESFDVESPSSPSSESSKSSHISTYGQKGDDAENDTIGPSSSSLSVNRENSQMNAKHVQSV